MYVPPGPSDFLTAESGPFGPCAQCGQATFEDIRLGMHSWQRAGGRGFRTIVEGGGRQRGVNFDETDRPTVMAVAARRTGCWIYLSL